MKTKNSKILKMHNTYNAKGITLIALVVTIIILIILAGVSINLILGDNGIIAKAKYAKTETEQAKLNEEIATNELMEQWDDIVGGSNTPIAYIITFNGTNVTSNGASTINKQETYTATLSPTTGYEIASITIKMGETILVENTDYTYTNGTIEIPNVIGNIEIIVDTKIVLTSGLKAGDYIKYNTGVEGIGVITCRVLYEASSQYGLQIISDKNVGPDITLGGSDWATGRYSYDSAIETLNNKAEKYLNTTYATDARCVGSVPTIDVNGIFTEKDTENAGPVKLKFPSTVEGANNMKDTDTNYGTDRTQMKNANINIWITEESYWLASRWVFSYSNECIFSVRIVGASGGSNRSICCRVYDDGKTSGDSDPYGLRPCFSLRADINITGGDGTSEKTAYTM